MTPWKEGDRRAPRPQHSLGPLRDAPRALGRAHAARRRTLRVGPLSRHSQFARQSAMKPERSVWPFDFEAHRASMSALWIQRALSEDPGSVGASSHSELAHQTGDVDADSLGGDEQCCADLPVRSPVAEQAENLRFALGEAEAVVAGGRRLVVEGPPDFAVGLCGRAALQAPGSVIGVRRRRVRWPRSGRRRPGGAGRPRRAALRRGAPGRRRTGGRRRARRAPRGLAARSRSRRGRRRGLSRLGTEPAGRGT